MHLGQPTNCEECRSPATMSFRVSTKLMQCQIHRASLITFGLFYQIIYYNRRIDQATAINLRHANFGSNFSIFICFSHFYSSCKVKGSSQKGIKKIGSKYSGIIINLSGKMLATALSRQLTNWRCGFRWLFLREVFMQMQLGSEQMDSKGYSGNYVLII